MKQIIITIILLANLGFTQDGYRNVEITSDKSAKMKVKDLSNGWTLYRVGSGKYVKYKINTPLVKSAKIVTEKGDTNKIETMSIDETVFWYSYIFKHLNYWNSYVSDTVAIIINKPNFSNCMDDIFYSWKIITQACYNECGTYRSQADKFERHSGKTINNMAMGKLSSTVSKVATGMDLVNMLNFTLITEKKSYDIYEEDYFFDDPSASGLTEQWSKDVCPKIIME